ncbi:MAG TPA: hypothetical protein VJU87_02030 [Gemmatimonadaceae bacterium]|nr:hypothetical protein [Gemmatimonadaceae bacterium]
MPDLPDDARPELPELTLSLRRFGSHRGGGGRTRAPQGGTGDDTQREGEQDRFFAPLLEARRRASSAASIPQIVAAFDARRLTAAMDATLRAYAGERQAARPPARRALEAELFEIVEPLRAELQRLRDRAEMLLVARSGAERNERWSIWLDQLRDVFRSADGTWISLERALRAAAPAGGKRK